MSVCQLADKGNCPKTHYYHTSCYAEENKQTLVITRLIIKITISSNLIGDHKPLYFILIDLETCNPIVCNPIVCNRTV